MKRSKNKPTNHALRQLHKPTPAKKLPFIAHIHEFRKRIFFVALSVGVFAGGAYAVQAQLTRWLLSPAGGQQFIYTSPGGGFDFQFRLCLYTGIAASIPVIIYQLLRYLHPLLKHETNRFLKWATFGSSVLAIAGVLFGYFFGLPAALHFLLQGFSTTKQIEALISIQSYMQFVTMYLLGTALLFQIPLIMLFINRIKPLPPKKLLSKQRWLIVGSLIIGAIISPTPDIRNQLVFSLPIIIMYNATVGVIWLVNHRHRRPRKVTELLRKDQKLRAERLARFQQARHSLRVIPDPSETRVVTSPARTLTSKQPTVPTARSRRYLQEFTRPRYSTRQLPGQLDY
jgi:sec-independent protein translocase protein TatC